MTDTVQEQCDIAKGFLRAVLEQAITNPEDTLAEIESELRAFARRLKIDVPSGDTERHGKLTARQELLYRVKRLNELREQAEIQCRRAQAERDKARKECTEAKSALGSAFLKASVSEDRQQLQEKVTKLEALLDLENDYEALRWIFRPVLDFDEVACPGLLTTTFPNGTRLSFGCGPNGKLNMVVIKNAEVSVRRKE